MSTRWKWVAGILIGLALSSESASAQTSQDFSGEVLGLATVRFSRPSFETESIVGTGVASGLGQFAVAEGEFDQIPAPGSIVTYGLGVFVTADGDQIYYYYEGPGSADPTGVYDLDLSATIIGGTGAYTQASGSFTLTGTLDPSTGILAVSIDGTVTTP